MNRWRPALAVIGLAAVTGGCGGRPASPASAGPFDPATFSAHAAWNEVEQLLAISPRVAGTPGAEQAAHHLLQRFRAIGLEAELDVFVDDTPTGPATFRNVIARLPGRADRWILLGSHYDTKAGISEDFVGANDSGSSTGALVELSRVMAEAASTPALGIAFVAFDGEEAARRYGPRDGFHGSRRYVRRLEAEGRLDTLHAMILMDMIGDRNLTVTIPPNGTPGLIALAFAAASEEQARSSFSLFPHAIADDHVAFLRAGIPAVNLIDFEYGSAPGRNDYWHTGEDTLDKLSPESLRVVGRVVIRMVNALLNEPDGLPDL